MDASFWYQKWAKNELGFHQSDINPFLTRHLAQFDLQPGARLFVPLCGKSLDMVWLCEQGFQVVGVELVPAAVEQFFTALGVTPVVQACGKLQRFSVPGLTLFVGDFFSLTAEQLGSIDLIYDRAALVALPPLMRQRYAAELPQMCDRAAQLLVTFDYDQSLLDGPPFAVPETEVRQLYARDYRLQVLSSVAVDGGPRAAVGAQEIAWQLMRV